MRPSIILIREWEAQMSGSGCCGRLQGDVLDIGGRRVFPERRQAMEAMGPLYRAIRARYGDAVEVMVVDPRNWVSLMIRLVRDFIRCRVPFGAILHTLNSISTVAVVLNGRIVARGDWPDPDIVLRRIDAVGEPSHAA